MSVKSTKYTTEERPVDVGYATGQDWTYSWGACKCTQLETSWVSHPSAKSLQSHPTLCDPLDCSLPGSSVHGILQTRMLESVDMPTSRWSQIRDQARVFYVSWIGGRFFTTSSTWEDPRTHKKSCLNVEQQEFRTPSSDTRFRFIV